MIARVAALAVAVSAAMWTTHAWADPATPPAPAGSTASTAAKPKPKAKPGPKKKPLKKKPPAPEPPPPPVPVEVAPTPPPAEEPPPAPLAPLAQPGGSIGVSADAGADVAVHHTLGDETPIRRFYFRAGVARVMPLAQSRELELANVQGPASLALQNGPIVGSGSTVDSATALAAVVGWKLGHTNHWSVETLLGAPFTVKFRATGTLANQSLAPTALGLPTGVQPLGPELGQATAAPPMVTLVYQLPHLGPIRPFAGAGASVLFALNAKVTNPILTQVSQPDFHVSPAPGLVLQTGFEAYLTHRIYARFDVKFIALMLARAEVTNIQVATPDLPLFGTVDVGTAKMSVWVNPLVVQAAIGTDF